MRIGRCKLLRQLYLRHTYFVEADGALTSLANKMHVVIKMITVAALFAQRILNRVIWRGYAVDDAFVDKSLQRSVNGNPVELVACFSFYVGVGQRAVRTNEQFQNLFPAACYTKLVPFEDHINNFTHNRRC